MFQIIVKEKGVFTNVTSPSTKAKLRLLFEVAPLALLVEKAGGASSCDGKCVSGLDVEVLQHDQRTQICYGSVGEVSAGLGWQGQAWRAACFSRPEAAVCQPSPHLPCGLRAF